MSYVIMDKGSLEGFQAGTFMSLGHLFYKWLSFDGSRKWVDSIADARTFRTEQDAWDYAEDVWGQEFASEQFLVVSVRMQAMDKAHGILPRIEAHQEKLKREMLNKETLRKKLDDVELERLLAEEELIEAHSQLKKIDAKIDAVRSKKKQLDDILEKALGYKLAEES